MTDIQVFTNPKFGEIRTSEYNGEIAFVAKDVLERLGIDVSNVGAKIAHVPDEWKGRHPMATPSGTQEMWVLTEQGLYFFLARSDKPLALPFQKWIAGEVIPLIRKTGGYSAVPKPTGMALVKEAMQFLIAENESQKFVIAAQKDKIEHDKPKVAFHDTFTESNVLCHFQGLANVLFNNGVNIGRNRLIRDLRTAGDVMQHEALFTQKAKDRNIGQNVPSGSYEHNGVTVVSYRAFLNYKGIVEVFDRYGLTQERRDAVMKDLMAADEPLSPEAGGEFPEGYFDEEVA